MKIKVRIGFNCADRNWPLAKELLSALKRDDLVVLGKSAFGWRLIFEDGDPKLPFVRERLKDLEAKADFAWTEDSEAIYTKEEIRAAPLLHLKFGRPYRGDGGPTHGTEYDLSNACPRCGCGAVQTSPLFLKYSQFPKKGLRFGTDEGDQLVSKEVRAAFAGFKFEGWELRQAVALKKGPMPWFQIIAPHFLPPVSRATKGVVRDSHPRSQPCPVCHRDAFFVDPKIPMQFVYDLMELNVESIPLVMRTWEAFGIRPPPADDPSKCDYGTHKFIVKLRFYEVFEKLEVKGVSFTPVNIQ
jgi:hypothetical protein